MRGTGFGDLEFSDLLIGPYLALVLWLFVQRRTGRRRSSSPLAGALPFALFFIAWTFLSTITAGLRFGFEVLLPVQFGLLKLLKLSVYGVAAWLTVGLVSNGRDLTRFLWAIAVGALVMAASMSLSAPGSSDSSIGGLFEYKSENAASVGLAILIMFLGAAFAANWGSRKWRSAAPWVLVAVFLGFAFSEGRGGWLAAALGLLWVLYRKGLKLRSWAIVGVVIVVGVVMYQKVPTFQEEMDRTLNPPPEYLHQYEVGMMGVDEGGRLSYWRREGSKILDAPLLGRGFFNRFPGSGLNWNGSHNFWLQMFLETGVVGGLVVLTIFWLFWKQSSKYSLLPSEAALVAGFVGGMGGEYFYGGMPLFSLIVVLAPLGLVTSGRASRVMTAQSPGVGG